MCHNLFALRGFWLSCVRSTVEDGPCWVSFLSCLVLLLAWCCVYAPYTLSMLVCQLQMKIWLGFNSHVHTTLILLFKWPPESSCDSIIRSQVLLKAGNCSTMGNHLAVNTWITSASFSTSLVFFWEKKIAAVNLEQLPHVPNLLLSPSCLQLPLSSDWFTASSEFSMPL